MREMSEREARNSAVEIAFTATLDSRLRGNDSEKAPTALAIAVSHVCVQG